MRRRLRLLDNCLRRPGFGQQGGVVLGVRSNTLSCVSPSVFAQILVATGPPCLDPATVPLGHPRRKKPRAKSPTRDERARAPVGKKARMNIRYRWCPERSVTTKRGRLIRPPPPNADDQVADQETTKAEGVCLNYSPIITP